MARPIPQPLICYFCEAPVTSDEFCYGCNKFICEECDHTGVVGKHEPEDHKELWP